MAPKTIKNTKKQYINENIIKKKKEEERDNKVM